MRSLAFLAPLAATLAVATAAQAQPAEVHVSFGSDLQQKLPQLGEPEVRREADRLADTVREALASAGALEGAQVALVLVDIQPNHPTFEQQARQPGLDRERSISLGGARIEGEVVTADGQHLPVHYELYSSNLDEVRGFTTWRDAERAFDRLAANLVAGRLVTR